MTSKNLDKKVLDLIEKAKTKRAEVKKIKKPKWKTSCSIDHNLYGGSTRLNIQVCNDLNALASFRYSMQNIVAARKSAEKAWGLKFNSKVAGYDAEEWISDVDLRVKVIDIKKEEEKLAKLESQLDALLSTEQKRELELERIAQELD